MTMATLKKRGPIRQFSLQCDSPKTPERRKSLIKQISEDYTDVNSKPVPQELGIRVSLCSKNLAKKPNEGPPPTKIAWTEKSPEVIPGSKDDGIIVRKCVDIKKTVNSPRRLRKQSSLDTDSILYSRQDFAKRLEQAWKDREASKMNLNIVLTHTTMEAKHDDVLVDVSNTVRPILNCDKIENNNKPKIILPLKPDLISAGSETNMKNVFQKRIRRTVKQKSLFEDSYSPTRIYDRNEKPRTIVVPLMDTKTIIDTNQNHNNKNLPNSTNESKQNSRPSTAASKRDMFQKRTNSAFHNSTTKKDSPSSSSSSRPPLLRTSSMPVKQNPPKPKFVATKRRVKTAKAKIKYEKEDFDEDCPSGRRSGALQRCVSVAGVLDVVTMVSLVSTSGSENEDDEEVDDVKEKIAPKSEANGENRIETVQKSDAAKSPDEEEKNFSLRKTVKSVSFQQSSIHAVRSFSASFPGRRCSMATGLFLNQSVNNNNINNNAHKIQEKRAPVNVLEDEESVPKRRLVRTKSAPSDKSDDNLEDEIDAADSKTNPEKTADAESSAVFDKDPRSVPDDPAAAKFTNPKERQCWEMYRRMNDKGVAISFDTILRGMLTPTEYRLRRKPSLLPEDNDEITGN